MRMCALLLMTSPPAVLAAEEIAGSMTLTANVRGRTLLTVSTDFLQFEIGEPGREAVPEVEFTAAVRTRSGGDVLLSVECVRDLERQRSPAPVLGPLAKAREFWPTRYARPPRRSLPAGTEADAGLDV